MPSSVSSCCKYSFCTRKNDSSAAFGARTFISERSSLRCSPASRGTFRFWYSVFSFNSDRIKYSRRSACVMFCSFLRASYLLGKKKPTVMSR